jgi:cytochrome c553
MVSQESVIVTCLIFLGLEGSPLRAADFATSESQSRHVQEMEEGLRLFNERVGEILTQNCLECHGGEKIEGDLDLSNRETLIASGLAGISAANSDLMDAITHRNEPFMPHERDKLEDADIDAIARWIDLGAPYARSLSDSPNRLRIGQVVVTDADRNYWAYRNLVKPALPEVTNNLWARNELDGFIMAEMENHGLTPSAEAKRRTLIRRAYLDAIGLPPTLEEVANFLNDLKPQAYERMIDRLLDSPQYGERWARHWMDIARFAESTGFEIDFTRPYAYHYRDFLIRAFNQNMPYDQFVQWQVAGDELKPNDPLALMATGFLGAGAFPSVLTEKEFESARYDELDDMVNTLGTAMLGTTFGCARCHDHKYDPITSEDYYQLAANFTRTVRSQVEIDSDGRNFESMKSQWELESNRLHTELQRYQTTVLEEPFQKWLDEGPFEIPLERWVVLQPESYSTRENATVERLWDDSVLVSGANPTTDMDILYFEGGTELMNITGLRMEALTHPTQGPGRDYEGRLAVREMKVDILDLGNRRASWKPVELASAEATSQENDQSLSAGAAINGVTESWSINQDGLGKDQALVIRFAKPVGFAGGTRFKVTVSTGLDVQQMIGRPRFSVTLDPQAPVEVSQGMRMNAYEGLLKLLVENDRSKLSEKKIDALREWYCRRDEGWLARRQAWIDHQLAQPVPEKTFIQVSSDTLPPVWHRAASKGFPSFYDSTYFLKRGDVNQKGAVADPGFPQVLLRNCDETGKIEDEAHPRSSLATWLTNVENGAGSLLARVFVNRVWYYHFGRGLVATPSDFGKQGGNPSHPDLLEWLAYDFVAHGWDVKRLQRQIMTCTTYRQVSDPDSGKSTIDPENRWLWRFTPRRAEAEVIRDSLLKVSGLLDPTQFGRGSRDPDMRRRSIYFFIKRGDLIPEMVLFDWPEHLVGIGQRTSSTIAPQALQFLNSPQARKYAEGFARRLDDAESPEEKIKTAYQIAFGRFPEDEEMQLGLAFMESQMGGYAEEENPLEKALVDYCQSLFSLNEFLYIR